MTAAEIDAFAIRMVTFTRKLIDEFATEHPDAETFVPVLEQAVRIVLEDELGEAVHARAVASLCACDTRRSRVRS
ncbi:MAG TPA: hypothetical protein VM733_02235 [Thermoanaerobaculia bacterium]|nr:hypothetical protein [Thermoanaerobaculia bacterium]